MTCFCGEAVQSGEVLSDLTVTGTRWTGHYHCVKAQLTPEQLLRAVELEMFPLLPEAGFVGRKLRKFAETPDHLAQQAAIRQFMETLEAGGESPA